jgi:hypothetical protein
MTFANFGPTTCASCNSFEEEKPRNTRIYTENEKKWIGRPFFFRVFRVFRGLVNSYESPTELVT